MRVREKCKTWKIEVPNVKYTDFGSHDELVVDDVVRRQPHPKQGAGGVKMAGHPSPTVDILSYTLHMRRISHGTHTS